MPRKDKMYRIVLVNNTILCRSGEWFFDGDHIDVEKMKLIRYYNEIS